ncbi:hypothetical protein HanRHA438_Chr02g0084571 [Helianthus annuus]|nr:hypothetical protein HanIR_Chr02g0085621 [Helianthus annuus]KAJ0619265.1 hypothetical protein HanHA89_Chr02g0069441 [Helianthus annuus]KAJ0940540.1 hypothetical protein HanRHA438_Chr02g0084571 [Helianthus annuus]
MGFFFINGLYGIRILTRVYIALFLSFNNTERTPFLYRSFQNPSAADTFSSKKLTSNTDFTSSLQVGLCSIIYKFVIDISFTRFSLSKP